MACATGAEVPGRERSPEKADDFSRFEAQLDQEF
jgi:hypothetical protein